MGLTEQKMLKRKLFNYFAEEHGIPLLESELEEISGFFIEEDEIRRIRDKELGGNRE